MKKLAKKLLHTYIYDLKIKTKLIISHTILFLLPITVLIGFLFLRIYDIVVDDTLRAEVALSTQSLNSIENLITHITHTAATLSDSPQVQELFHVKLSQAQTALIEDENMGLINQMAEGLEDHSLIKDIRIYYDDTVYADLTACNSRENPLFAPVSSVADSNWYQILNGSEKSSLFCPGPCLAPEAGAEPDSFRFITKISYAYEADTAQPPKASAYVVLYLSPNYLVEVLRNDSPLSGEISFLINAYGNIGAASDASLAAAYPLLPDDFPEIIGDSGSFRLVSYEKEDAYTAYFPIKGTDWYLVSIVSASHVADAGKQIILRFFVIYGGFALLALFIAFQLSVSFANRIINVALQMEKVRSGPPKKLEIEDSGCDEIGILADTYNYMTEEILLLMESQKQAAEELRKAEFRALQAQINPHFLYNTLDMINWLAQSGQTEKVTQAVQALSRFYKLTLGRRELTNTIGQELEHVSLYVKLQNMRYDDCANFIVDVPEELSSYTIPKLTFQPIVENAILHGIMMKEEKKGTILLTGWLLGNDIQFVISDDGAGIAPEKLEMLLDKNGVEQSLRSYQSPRSSSLHIGVYNTNLRLKSLYGENYGLTFTSVLGKGTEVTIRIPGNRAI